MPALGCHYLGRFSRGQYVSVIVNLGDLPDDSPVVWLWRNGTELIRELELPRIKAPTRTFRYSLLLDTDFTDGNYVAVCKSVMAGDQVVDALYFEVVGGEGLAPLIQITEIERPLGRAVVSQSADGTAKIAYRPRRSI